MRYKLKKDINGAEKGTEFEFKQGEGLLLKVSGPFEEYEAINKLIYIIGVSDTYFFELIEEEPKSIEIIEDLGLGECLGKCYCGNIKKFRKRNIESGNTKSCGCGRKDNSKTHGMSETKIYGVYKSLKQRCENKNDQAYEYYGGRGIKCEWESFEEFYSDMGDTYKEGLTIDRENNDWHYCKENCRWATMGEQSLNRRDNILYNGKPAILLADYFGINRGTFRSRYFRYKDIAKALYLSEDELQEAEQELSKRKALATIKKWSYENDGGYEFKQHDDENYCVGLWKTPSETILDINGGDNDYQYPNVQYYSSLDKANQALKELEAEYKILFNLD